MHWTRLSLLCLCAAVFGVATTASAQVTDQTSGVVQLDNFSGSMSLSDDGGTYMMFDRMNGDGVGFINSYSRFGIRGKLFDTGATHLFTEINGVITDQSRLGANLGGGVRTMIDGGVLGLHGWYDSYETTHGNTYQQAVIGAEYLHRWLDVRANGYMPFGNREHELGVLSPGTTPVFFGNSFGTIGTAQVERSLAGFDLEGGVPLPIVNWLRVYGGTYFLTASDQDTWGAKGRVEARVGPGTSVNFLVSDDDRFGTNLNLQVQMTLGRGRMPGRFSPDVSGYARRYDPVRRAQTVQVAYDKAPINVAMINTDTGKPFDITWVDNTATGPGDGTFEHPFVQLPNAAPTSDHILVRTGAGDTLGNIALVDNQHLWGEGHIYTLNTNRLGTITIPDTIFHQTGPRPTLRAQNPALPIVTLANNNEVINFNMIGGGGPTGVGIYGQNIQNFHIDSVNVTATNGLIIDNADGLGIVSNSQFHASGVGTGASFVNNGDGLLDLVLDTVATSGGQNGIAISAEQAAIQTSLSAINVDSTTGGGVGLLLNEQQGTLLANLDNVHVLNTNALGDVGMRLNADNGGLLSVAMNNVTSQAQNDLLQVSANSATVRLDAEASNFSGSVHGSGINIDAVNSVAVIRLDDVSLNTNGDGLGNDDGFRLAASSGSQVSASIANSEMFGNQDDNLDVTAVSGADVAFSVSNSDASASVLGSGYELFVDGAGSSVASTFNTVDLSNAGLNAIDALIQNGAATRMDLVGVQGSGAGTNGLNLDVENQGQFVGVVRNSAFAGSGNVGVNVDVVNGSSAYLDLGGVVASGNGDRGFNFNVAAGADGASGLTALANNVDFSDNQLSNVSGQASGAGSFADLQFNNVIADNLANDSGVNLAASGGAGINVAWTGDDSSISNTNANGVQLQATDPGSQINFSFSGGSIDNNALDGIDASLTGGAGSRLSVAVNNASVSGNGANGIDYALSGLNAVGRIDINNTPLSGNGADGLEFNVNSGALLTVAGADGDFSNNGERGIEGSVDGAGSIATIDLTGASLNSNDLQGALFNATNDGLLSATLNGATATGNGEENLRANALTGGDLALRAIGGDFSGGGTNGVFDNVHIDAANAGSSATVVFDNLNMDGGTNNGLLLQASDQASVYSELRGETGTLSASGNAAAGLRVLSDNAAQMIVLTSGDTVFNNNAAGGVDADVNSTDTAVIGVGSTIDGNGADGVNIAFDNVTTGAIAVRGPGSVSNNAGDGIEIDVANSTLANFGIGTAAINGLEITDLAVLGNAGEAIDINLNNSTVSNVNVSGNTLDGMGTSSNGIVVDTNNNSVGDINVNGNTLQGFTNNGIWVLADSESHNISASGNTVTGSGSTNILVELSGTAVATQLLVDDNIVDGLAGTTLLDGIRVNVADNAQIVNGSISGNSSSGNGEHGIHVDVADVGTVGTLLIDGTVAANNNAAGGILYSGAPGTGLTTLSISDSASIAGSGGNGVEVQLNSVTGDPDVRISGNTVSDSAGEGILFNGVDTANQDLALNNNVVTNSAGGDGIQISMTNPGGAASLLSLTASGNSVSGSAADGMNILLDSLDTTTNVPSIDLAANTITNNAGRGLAFSALDMSINNLLVRNSTVSNNTGGDGIFLNLDNQSGAAQTANRIEITNTTSDANAGDGAQINLTNMTVAGDVSVAGGSLSNNTGNGLFYNANGSSNALLNVSDVAINANTGGDGVNLVMSGSPTSIVNIADSNISNNAANGVGLNLAAGSNVGEMFVTGNTINANGTNGINFNVADSTLPDASTPITIADNTITNHAAGDGIRMVLPDTNGAVIGMDLVSNNISTNAGGNGVNVQLDSNSGGMTSNVLGNTVNGNGQNGFLYTMSGAAVLDVADFSGNTVNGHTAGMGVRIQGSGTSQTTFNAGVNGANVLNANTGAAIGLDMTDNSHVNISLTNTTLSNTINGGNANFSGDGFAARMRDNSAISAVIESSTITGNAGSGIRASVTGDNLASFSTIESFRIGGATADLGNVIQNNGFRGIDFLRTADGRIGTVDPVSIQNNLIQNNAEDGIHLSARNALRTDRYVIADNGLFDNGGDGMHFDVQADANMFVDVLRNDIDGNNGNGILTTEQINFPTDRRGVSGAWQQNIVSNNAGDGIDISAVAGNSITGDILLIGSEIDASLGNMITNNGFDGVRVNGGGTSSISNNLIAGNAFHGVEIFGATFKSTTLVANHITDNGFGANANGEIGDGVEFNNNGGGFMELVMLGNTIDFNAGRGIDILNQNDAFSDVTIGTDLNTGLGNVVNANGGEGIYIVNTASASQNQSDPTPSDGITPNVTEGVAGTDQAVNAATHKGMNRDGDLRDSAFLNIVIDNATVIGNGQNSDFQATGIVTRVGTTGGGYDRFDSGGFASSGRGGVVMALTNSSLGGNFGDDLYFDSFTSTVNPVVTAGAWTENTDDPTAAEFRVDNYEGDALARLDLTYRNVNRESALITAQGAYYDNAEGVFKSRLNNIAAPNLGGPFANAARRRNAQRLAAREYPDGTKLPPNSLISDAGGSFLYPGMGDSTFRLNLANSDNIFTLAGEGFLIDNFPVGSPIQNPGDMSGTFYPIGGNTQNSPWGWGTF